MSTVKKEAVVLTIMGKEYKIACEPEERQRLIESAQLLDKQMRQIRDSGKVNGADRIAVMAALNLVHELSFLKSQNDSLRFDFGSSLADMIQKIENVLENR
ncbi:cell division protein ZapA [Methylomicrobium sp. RS1]|jgi:cell division protein ZapA|uniref:cell division protein ZapA n=1 Tax=Candidatus Methylomicrobium oryzae TaxID=2802053 RepID=UPI001922F291|nr:cell division protein ZapA [Methylomicrobium sp. RS1]MBL1264772.1 cell division protein ZapA [Methylomicrobium sp. RS1]